MTLHFTLAEMITSLTKIGYEITEEVIVKTVPYYNDQVQEIPTPTLVVRYKGVSMCEDQGLFGNDRVIYIFKQELHKKLLNLF